MVEHKGERKKGAKLEYHGKEPKPDYQGGYHGKEPKPETKTQKKKK